MNRGAYRPKTDPACVDLAFYIGAVEQLEHLQALLLCIGADDRKAFKALSSKEKTQMLSLAYSLACDVQRELDGGVHPG